MKYQLLRKPIGDAIHFGSVTDPKFKHNRISVSFIVPLDKEKASHYAVAPFILRKGYRECPDFTALNARLYELYGAGLEANISKFGQYQILSVAIRGLDNRFALENEDIVGACADMLASVVLDPNLIDGVFTTEDTELEKQFVLDTIEAQINDKRSYALAQCIQAMCEGEPQAVRRFGDRETAQTITPQSAVNAYHELLRFAPVEILFTGCGNPEAAEKVFADSFASVVRSPRALAETPTKEKAGEVKDVEESMELSQSKLVMGFRTGKLVTDEQLTAARMFAALYGGTPFSKLFLNVREKLSLCYYCSARFDISTKILLVDSGIEKANLEKAKAEILAQLKAVQNGEITEEELVNTKLLLKNSITTTTDSLSSIEGWYLSQILRGQSSSPEEDAKKIDAVTIQQIVDVAKGVTLDTVYFLSGNETQEAKAE